MTTTAPARFCVRDYDGNVFRVTQAEWDARDVFTGWVRVDEHGNELTDDGEPVPVQSPMEWA